MNHQPFRRILTDSDTAFLFIHGIVGTPDHFDFILDLVPDHISVVNLLLDGHGGSVRDFSHTSMEKWENQVDNELSILSATHENIYVVAHSMGTLFAVHHAIGNQQIKGLFLMAVPIIAFPRPLMISNAIKVYRGAIRPDDLHGTAARAACSIKSSRNLLEYLGWIPRYVELLRKIKDTRKILDKLDTTCIAFQSAHDEMVAHRGAGYLRKHSKMDVHLLNNSYHYLYDSTDRSFIQQQFLIFINNIK